MKFRKTLTKFKEDIDEIVDDEDEDEHKEKAQKSNSQEQCF